ncbi:MAG: hypothetical protein JGK08_21795 [Microcoleus sp. PH2017_04_SCI_O_A]|nr:hypothetical protein [Microcoleus sp. PH2017_04_SCI_O_A]
MHRWSETGFLPLMSAVTKDLRKNPVSLVLMRKSQIRKYQVRFNLTKIPKSTIMVDCLSKSGSDQVKTFQKLETTVNCQLSTVN